MKCVPQSRHLLGLILALTFSISRAASAQKVANTAVTGIFSTNFKMQYSENDTNPVIVAQITNLSASAQVIRYRNDFTNFDVDVLHEGRIVPKTGLLRHGITFSGPSDMTLTKGASFEVRFELGRFYDLSAGNYIARVTYSIKDPLNSVISQQTQDLPFHV